MYFHLILNKNNVYSVAPNAERHFFMELYISLSVLAVLILLCLFSSKISSLVNLPSLLLFLAVGLLAGSEGLGGLEFSNAQAANYLGSTAMAFILFSGGFDTDWKFIRPIMLTGGILSSFGVLLTAAFCGIGTWSMFHFFAPELGIKLSWCLLLGCIISSTDAAAVFSILRSKSVSLKGNLQPLLEFESGSNDPMAAFLTVFMAGIVTMEAETGSTVAVSEYLSIVPWFAVKMSVGVVWGYLVGRTAVWIYNKINFDYNGLYYVLGVAIVLFTYSTTELFMGNGFMAVYITGMTMGNMRFVFHNGLGRFYDGISWMMQVILFTMLGLLAFPTQVWDAKWYGLGAAFILMFIARPLSVFIGMSGSKFTLADRTLVSWVGLRGGAPIMLATIPLMMEIPQATFMFHIVFFIVITSVLLQGMTIMPCAKLLKLDAPLHKMPRLPLSIEETGDKHTISREFLVTADKDKNVIANVSLPGNALILLIRRDDGIIVPRGSTVLLEGDILTVLGSSESIEECRSLFQEC